LAPNDRVHSREIEWVKSKGAGRRAGQVARADGAHDTFVRQKIAVAVVSFATALAALFAGGKPAVADPGDIAFDQLLRSYVAGATPPAFGTYDSLKATFETLGASVTYPPVPGAALPIAADGTVGTGNGGPLQSLARGREGLAYHYSFLGALARFDDPGSRKATIVRPDKGEVDLVDFAAKTYVRVTGEAARALLDTGLAKQLRKMIPPAADTAQHGTLALTLTTTEKPLDAVTIDGIAAAGAVLTVALGTATHTGACPVMTVTNVETAYVDPTRAERVAPQPSDSNVSDVLPLMARFGCAAHLEGAVPTPDPALRHFAMYARIDVTVSIPALPTPISFSSVVQRAHVVPLTAADAGLFEIPAGFRPAAPAAPETPATPATPAPATK
jgi:hypothetical protein